MSATGAPQGNMAAYKIIDGTLAEGEAVAGASFDRETKVTIAKSLDSFGVDYIAVADPGASQQAFDDCKAIAGLGLKAKILAYVPCRMDDAKRAVEAGVGGVNLVIGSSSFQADVPHEKSVELIQESALEVIAHLKSQNVEVQVSFEDDFRADVVDLLSLYRAVEEAGADRVGVNDILGGKTPRAVYENIRALRGVVKGPIDCRFHDDTSCGVGNAVTALEAGATHIATTVLAIGPQNGLVPIGPFSARMLVSAGDYTRQKYNLKELKTLENLVAEALDISIPYNHPVTGFSAFTHKAGIHAKAILNNPSTYEVMDPADFGISRNVVINSRVTGWNAVRSRVDTLGLEMTDDQVKELTAKIKQTADAGPLTPDQTDEIIHEFHRGLRQK